MSNAEFDPLSKLKTEKEKAEWRKKAYERFKAELLENPEFHKIADSQYMVRPDSKESFAGNYAEDKVRWIEWGPKHIVWQESDDLQWVDDAFNRLKEIQQKKLFDLQCLWRAEKVEVPEVEASVDFEAWEWNILNCPIIDPIDDDDVEIYRQYLASNNFEFEQWFLDNWQEYDEIKEAYQNENANRNFPDWYDFHNGRTGKGVYMTLPNVRGEKEEHYANLSIQEEQKESEVRMQQAANNPNIDRRPGISYHKKGFVTWFVSTFEDKETQEMFRDYGGEIQWDSQSEVIENNVDLLRKAGKPISIDGWHDWREALQRCADKYSIMKISEALPAAYEQYKMQLEMGLPFIEEDPGYWDDIVKLEKERILNGREMTGEDRNFDF